MNDYGYINGAYNTPIPNRQEIRHTQVYMATHKGEGANARLPFMNRSFISFSFSDKPKEGEEEKRIYIEDFNLIATIDGDRLERKGYSEFEDLTSDYQVLDGHFYWGTHYTNHELTFDLATDAMTQNQLDNFLHWFQPGKVRELILSEHPNRAVQARVSAAPELHLLPFEQPTIKKIAGQDYKTSTTLYKGEITLTFVMEEPYWYSKISIFGYYDGNMYHDVWIDANSNKEVSIFDDPDAIKIALEDNIPIAGMVDASMLFGDNSFADVNNEEGAITAIMPDDSMVIYKIQDGETIKWVYQGQAYTSITINNEHQYIFGEETTILTSDPIYEIDLDLSPVNQEQKWRTQEQLDTAIPDNARIALVNGNDIWGARISGAIMSENTGIEDFGPGQSYYFYYAGNAPSQPTVEFRLTPRINNNGYITTPNNNYASDGENHYNTITFESLNKKELQFTTPSVYTGYNQAIKIFSEADSNTSWVNIRKSIRDYVNHPAARAWANKVIDSFSEDTTINNNGSLAVNRMKYFLQNENSEYLSSSFIINSKTGRAIGQLKYRVPDSNAVENWQTYGILIDSNFSNEEEDKRYSAMIHEEDVGDMIRSNYLIIEDQNQPTEDGHIKAWEDINDTTRLQSHVIRHDVVGGLKNVFVKYQNMYL